MMSIKNTDWDFLQTRGNIIGSGDTGSECVQRSLVCLYVQGCRMHSLLGTYTYHIQIAETVERKTTGGPGVFIWYVHIPRSVGIHAHAIFSMNMVLTQEENPERKAEKNLGLMKIKG